MEFGLKHHSALTAIPGTVTFGFVLPTKLIYRSIFSSDSAVMI